MWDRLVDNLFFPLIAGFILWLFDKYLTRRRSVKVVPKVDKNSRVTAKDKSQKSNFIKAFLEEPITRYTLIIATAISVTSILESAYPVLVNNASKLGLYWLPENYPFFVTQDDRQFVLGFIEWFGSIYSVLLVAGFIIAWIQLNQIGQIFDKEAASIKILHDSVMTLDNQNLRYNKALLVGKLFLYARHILEHYWNEHLDESAELRSKGDNILREVRKEYMRLLSQETTAKYPVLSVVANEILQRSNDATRLREERISILGKKHFQIFRAFLVVCSILWIIPFYFSAFDTGIFSSFLKLALTFLVIFTLAAVDDMDDPFFGVWHISILAWRQAKEDLKLSFYSLQIAKRAALKVRKRKTNNQKQLHQKPD